MHIVDCHVENITITTRLEFRLLHHVFIRELIHSDAQH